MLPQRSPTPHLIYILSYLGLGCGGGGSGSGTPGGSTEGVNASEERVQAVANAVCQKNARCRKDQFEDDYDSISDCIEERAFSYRPHNAADNFCADAYLDQAACYAGISCNTDQQEACGDLLDLVTPACS